MYDQAKYNNIYNSIYIVYTVHSLSCVELSGPQLTIVNHRFERSLVSHHRHKQPLRRQVGAQPVFVASCQLATAPLLRPGWSGKADGLPAGIKSWPRICKRSKSVPQEPRWPVTKTGGSWISARPVFLSRRQCRSRPWVQL